LNVYEQSIDTGVKGISV